MPSQKKTESERFKGPAKYVEFWFARALITVLQRLPIHGAHRLGRFAGWLAWKLMARRRATVRKNLEIVDAWMRAQSANSEWRLNDGGEAAEERAAVPGKRNTRNDSSSHPLEVRVREVFQRTGANLFAGFTFNRMSPEQVARHFRLEGIEHLKGALAEGRGAIVLLAHMGPWEALTQLPDLASAYGVNAPFGAIYRPFNNAYLDGWFKRQREQKGTRLFGSRYRFLAPVDFLRGGGILGVLADQRTSGGNPVRYFGQVTHATPLPGLLHLRSKAPVLSLSIRSLAPAQWGLRFRQHELGGAPGPDARSELAQATAGVVETVLLDSLCDGFWFSDRFKDARRTSQNQNLR